MYNPFQRLCSACTSVKIVFSFHFCSSSASKPAKSSFPLSAVGVWDLSEAQSLCTFLKISLWTHPIWFRSNFNENYPCQRLCLGHLQKQLKALSSQWKRQVRNILVSAIGINENICFQSTKIRKLIMKTANWGNSTKFARWNQFVRTTQTNFLSSTLVRCKIEFGKKYSE